MTSTVTASDLQNIRQAVTIINHGGIIAYPTEAVYGLGCDPDNDHALEKLLHLKQRSPQKGLILVSDDFSRLKPYLENIAPDIAQRAFASWPGPYTWLWPARRSISRQLRGEFATLAVRVSRHPVIKQLCHYAGKPLVSTSANIATQSPALTVATIEEYFPSGIDLILQGQLGTQSRPSEIRDLISNRLVRA